MEGFLGTRAWFRSDLALVLVWALGLAAVAGWRLARRRRFSPHCRLMAVAALLNWVPVLIVMVPPWLGVASRPGVLAASSRTFAPFAHGLAGIVAQLLMTYTVVRMYWLKRLPPRRARWLMLVTVVVWLLAAIGGTGLYLLLYVS